MELPHEDPKGRDPTPPNFTPRIIDQRVSWNRFDILVNEDDPPGLGGVGEANDVLWGFVTPTDIAIVGPDPATPGLYFNNRNAVLPFVQIQSLIALLDLPVATQATLRIGGFVFHRKNPRHPGEDHAVLGWTSYIWYRSVETDGSYSEVLDHAVLTKTGMRRMIRGLYNNWDVTIRGL